MAGAREVEQVFLDVVVAEVVRGLSRVVIINGGPGAGKTWLLDRLAAAARAAGLRVLAAVPAGGPARPTLLLLDDAHAHPGAIGLVRRLLEHPPDAPVLVAVALDPGLATDELREAVRELDRRPWASRIELDPAPSERRCGWVLLEGSTPR